MIGGGISGLAAAWQLCDALPSAQVVVLEAAGEIGGKLRAAELAGVRVDVGAEAMLARRPEGVELVRALGLSDELIAPMTLAARVRVGGRARPLPAGTMLGIPGNLEALRNSGVLSDAGYARVVAELDSTPLQALDGDVAVGELVRSRLGDEVVDRLVEPLLGGVYAGRADALSLDATMPALAARLMHDGGSLVSAAAATVGAGTDSAPPVHAAGATNPVFVSLPGGLARLAEALATAGRFEVRTGVTVRSLRQTPTGLRLECGAASAVEYIDADAVVVATPAPKAARLLTGVAPVAAAELGGIETASMAIVSLAFTGIVPPPGSGLLVGTGEGLAVKAVTISSQKWPGTPPGLTLIRASIGRAGETRELQRDDGELIDLARHDLNELTGIAAPPVDALVTRWGGALPQFGVGHRERVSRIRATVGQVAGLAVCGAAYDGVGIPACIASASRAVESILGAQQRAR